MPITIRDVRESFSSKLNKKQDKDIIIRAVITDGYGNQSGAGSIWANFNTRRIWYMAHGASQPAQIRCTRIPNPYIGLKCLIGHYQGSTELEVVSDDPFDRVTNPNGSDWTTMSTEDMQPGGRALLWLQPKAFVPLAVWPGTGLAVNINPGNLELDGTRLTYAGISNYDLSTHQPAGPNEHLLVGLYLDNTGALNAIDGATVSTALTAPAPAWPATNIFRLSTVELDDTQTTIDFANDITDQKTIYTEMAGFGGGIIPIQRSWFGI